MWYRLIVIEWYEKKIEGETVIVTITMFWSVDGSMAEVQTSYTYMYMTVCPLPSAGEP